MNKLIKELTFASVVITLAFKGFVKYVKHWEEKYGNKPGNTGKQPH